MSKRQRIEPRWDQLPAPLLRLAADFARCADYINARSTCKSWKAALDCGADLRRPWLVTTYAVARRMQFGGRTDVAEFLLRSGVAALVDRAVRAGVTHLDLDMQPARYRGSVRVFVVEDQAASTMVESRLVDGVSDASHGRFLAELCDDVYERLVQLLP